MSTILSFKDLNGDTSLAERGKQKENGFWGSNDLAVGGSDDMTMDVAVLREDEDGNSVTPVINIEISCYHFENKEAGRAFHCHLQARINREQANQLRGYIDYLLQYEVQS